MPETVEVFENEEAERFLDYFVAFRKFSDKAECLKRIAAVNSEVASFESNLQLAKAEDLDTIGKDQTAIDLASSCVGAESIPNRL